MEPLNSAQISWIARNSSSGERGGRQNNNMHFDLFIDAPKDELDRIERVTYQLHETFKPPVYTVNDRETQFGFGFNCWGVFLVHATIDYRDGTIRSISRMLSFS